MHKNFLLGVLIVVLIVLLAHSDMCKKWQSGSGCGCTGACKCNQPVVENVTASVSKEVAEAFSSRPYGYNKDTVGKGVAWQADASKDTVMSHDDYIRSVGIDKSTAENHREWYEDPNIKPYYGSNFNLRSETEQAFLVPTVGLRRRATRVPIGVSSRQVPDIDERDYAEDNQLVLGNFV